MAHFEKAPEGCRQEQKKGDAANAAPPHTVKKASQSLRPQAQIKSKLFSPAACTSGKILIALQVWNFCAESAEIMRAAGCNPLQTRAQRSGKGKSKSSILLLELIQRCRVFVLVKNTFLTSTKTLLSEGVIVIRYDFALRGAENGVTVMVTPFFCVQG